MSFWSLHSTFKTASFSLVAYMTTHVLRLPHWVKRDDQSSFKTWECTLVTLRPDRAIILWVSAVIPCCCGIRSGHSTTRMHLYRASGKTATDSKRTQCWKEDKETQGCAWQQVVQVLTSGWVTVKPTCVRKMSIRAYNACCCLDRSRVFFGQIWVSYPTKHGVLHMHKPHLNWTRESACRQQWRQKWQRWQQWRNTKAIIVWVLLKVNEMLLGWDRPFIQSGIYQSLFPV